MVKRMIEALGHSHKMRAFHVPKSCCIGVVG